MMPFTKKKKNTKNKDPHKKMTANDYLESTHRKEVCFFFFFLTERVMWVINFAPPQDVKREVYAVLSGIKW